MRGRIPREVSSVPIALLVCLLGLGVATADAAQNPFPLPELAGYRLTDAVFVRFEDATTRLAAAARADARFDNAPLFTRDLALLEDAPTAAGQLELRLRVEPAFARALNEAAISRREYTKFALTLLGAHVAHGFVTAGVLRGVPPGVTADNVTFVKERQADVVAVLADMGVRH